MLTLPLTASSFFTVPLLGLLQGSFKGFFGVPFSVLVFLEGFFTKSLYSG